MKVITFGSPNGLIASHLPYPIMNDRLRDDGKQIRAILEREKPDAVVNGIAYCGGKNIDGCEDDKPRTLLSNLVIPTILGAECAALGIKFVHIGSGCINYGESPNLKVSLENGPEDLGWRETDDPKLQYASFYSKIKYAADLALKDLETSCILRIRMPITSRKTSRNLITKLLSFQKVLDHPNSVTFLSDLVRLVDWVIRNDKTGVYHATNPEPLTHPQILNEYRKYHPEHSFETINEEELKQYTSAPRSNCLINTDKLTSEGFEMSPTIPMLEKTMKEFVSHDR